MPKKINNHYLIVMFPGLDVVGLQLFPVVSGSDVVGLPLVVISLEQNRKEWTYISLELPQWRPEGAEKELKSFSF